MTLRARHRTARTLLFVTTLILLGILSATASIGSYWQLVSLLQAQRLVAIIGIPAIVAGIILAYRFFFDTHQGRSKQPSTQIQKTVTLQDKSLENANIIVLRWGPHGTIRSVNNFTERLFGYPAQLIIGRQLIGTLVAETESTGRDLRQVYRKIELHPMKYPNHECEHLRRDGSKIWICWTNTPVFDSAGNLVEILSIGHDITKRKRSERNLLLTASVFDYSIEGFMIIDAQGRILKVNGAFTRITGIPREQVVGKTPAAFCAGPNKLAFFDELWRSVEDSGSWQGEIAVQRHTGELLPAWLSLSSVKNKKGRVTHYIGLVSDITDKKLSEQRIQQLAFFDELTELPNRVLFLNRLTHALAKAKRESLSIPILYVNLNRFKIINDSLGHDKGDLLLKLVADRLRACIRGSDTIARMGGDEFTVIVEPLIDKEEVVRIGTRVAQSIVESMARPFNLDGYEAFVSLSIGIVSFPQDGRLPSELLKNADTAVTHARQKGPNRYLFYESKMNATAMKRMQMATDMHKALDRGEFRLHYQPTLDLQSGKITGVEALVRWQHPQLGSILPLQFIPLAEETGLIVPLGEWVFAEAIRQTKEWHLTGISPLRVAINLSVYNLRSKELLQFIRLMLKEIDLPADSVGLELTESVFMTDVEDIKSVLAELDEIGIQLLIDDFGTEYSSLSRLKELPAQILKIDRSFIQGIPNNPENACLVTAIIGMAHSLNMRVIAEGIEIQDQLTFLREQGCDEVQGYLIGRPVPAFECAELIIRTNQIDLPQPVI